MRAWALRSLAEATMFMALVDLLGLFDRGYLILTSLSAGMAPPLDLA